MQIDNQTTETVTYEAKDEDTDEPKKQKSCRGSLGPKEKKNVKCTESSSHWTVQIFRSPAGELTGVDGKKGDLIFEPHGNGHHLRRR